MTDQIALLVFMIFLVLIITALITFVIVTKINNTPEALGKRGESAVKKIIGETIENEQYVINNLTILNDGMTSQIDHIVINCRGVFVIETKNYSGKIYGSVNQREWTQVLAGGNVKNKFYNPIKQNATHVYHVNKIVGKIPVYSLIVFVQNNNSNIEASNVVSLYALRDKLNNGANVITVGQMKRAYNALISRNEQIQLCEHVNNIRVQQYNLEHNICPRCGGKLVLRNGQYGEFWGCSNYPKCKFIKKEDQDKIAS